jgi:hypothetical protein
VSGEITGCSGCATSAGRMACPDHGPSAHAGVLAAMQMHQHQWRTDTVTDGWYFAIQTCAVPGCGIVRRVRITEPPA